MALAPAASSTASPVDDGSHIDAPELRVFVIALFFIFGGITSLNDVIIPKLKELFTLDYFQAMLVQTAFFAAYGLIGIPGALDADYFLDAQEYDGVWDLKVEVMMTDPGKAVARVSMKIYSPKNRSGDASQDGRTFRILLVAEQGEWRIWDLVLIVRGEPDNSWRASLKQDIDGFRHPEK